MARRLAVIATVLVAVLGGIGGGLYASGRYVGCKASTIHVVWVLGSLGSIACGVHCAKYMKTKSCVPRYARVGGVFSFLFNEAAVFSFLSCFVVPTKGAPFTSRYTAPCALSMAYLAFAANVHECMLTKGHVRSLLYRCLFAYPTSIFCATVTMLAVGAPLWALIPEPYNIVPYLSALALAAGGVFQSLHHPPPHQWDYVALDIGELAAPHETPRCLPLQRSAFGNRPVSPGALRIVQIADPHLSSFMTPERLRRLCEEAVAVQPSLLLLTGDFFTVEANAMDNVLAWSLAPLSALSGRVFACLGNHDLESTAVLDQVISALRSINAKLLRDAEEVVQTEAGLISMVGFDFKWGVAATKAFFQKHPPPAGAALRITLLHDPAGFGVIPQSSVRNVVFSGHTHGGHIGLFSLGLQHITTLRIMYSFDNGLWSLRDNLLYVHRGQGFRSLFASPITRLGVPPEYAVVDLRLPVASTHGKAL